MHKLLLLILISFNINLHAIAQNTRVDGEIIKGYGDFFTVENPDIKTDTTATFKVIFDVSKGSENRNEVNKYIVTAARFLNMHAHEGMKPKQLKAAMTIHGRAWQDVLNNEAYKEKFGVDNPNFKLINELNAAGVDIIICGQTAKYREITHQNINPSVKFALSAMTALLQYQSNGYTFIKF